MVDFMSGLGMYLGEVEGFEFHEFPSLEKLAMVTEDELRKAGFGYRSTLHFLISFFIFSVSSRLIFFFSENCLVKKNYELKENKNAENGFCIILGFYSKSVFEFI